MLTYLSQERERLGSAKSGMEKNSAIWTPQSVQITDVEQMITRIDAKDAEVETAKQLLSLRQSEARELSGEACKLADKVDNLARGFHSGAEEKLIEYGIRQKKSAMPKKIPSDKLIITIEDDTDGEGFILIARYDSSADYYEWQKGYGTNAADDKTIPELKNFKTTKKTSFVDDEVPKGVRVFYKVRAANTNGAGPWSEAVSKVQ
jgi:hypothetical protein